VAHQVTYSLKAEGRIMIVGKWRSLEQEETKEMKGSQQIECHQDQASKLFSLASEIAI
jgi:mRNA deadenylase 3'-5' endonuclease subunit Ccr4